MIAIDSSAVMAILIGEPEKDAFEDVIAGAQCLMSAVNADETATVLRIRAGRRAVELFWQFLADTGIEIVAFDTMQVRAAAIAFDRYGKGIDPRAKLNLSDCAAYALAKTLDIPLLFKGADFIHTDLKAAI
jgi:ribonuclease VapC